MRKRVLLNTVQFRIPLLGCLFASCHQRAPQICRLTALALDEGQVAKLRRFDLVVDIASTTLKTHT
jgi:hypothetical protein